MSLKEESRRGVTLVGSVKSRRRGQNFGLTIPAAPLFRNGIGSLWAWIR
jgi:hypothetical protein